MKKIKTITLTKYSYQNFVKKIVILRILKNCTFSKLKMWRKWICGFALFYIILNKKLSNFFLWDLQKKLLFFQWTQDENKLFLLQIKANISFFSYNNSYFSLYKKFLPFIILSYACLLQIMFIKEINKVKSYIKC